LSANHSQIQSLSDKQKCFEEWLHDSLLNLFLNHKDMGLDDKTDYWKECARISGLHLDREPENDCSSLVKDQAARDLCREKELHHFLTSKMLNTKKG
jgi:hypothetical protein